MNYVEFLKDLKVCPFCEGKRIKIIENDTAYLTFAVAPYHPDHLLVVPKRHIEKFLDLEEAELKDINLLQKRGLEILNKLGYVDTCLLIKEGDIREKSVAHIHFHLIPDIILGAANHTGADRVVLTDLEISNLIIRIKGAI